MLLRKSVSSNALAISVLFLSSSSFAEAQSRRRARDASISSSSLTSAIGVGSSTPPSSPPPCPSQATVTVTITATSGSVTPSAVPSPTSTNVGSSASSTASSAMSLTSSSSVVSSTNTVGSSVSSTSTTATSTATPGVAGSGSVNITSKCSFPVYWLFTSAQDSSEKWTPFPAEGVNLSLSAYPLVKNNVDRVWLGFSKTPDSGYDNGHNQFGFIWDPVNNQVMFSLSETATNGTDPFMLDGYNAWPTPNNTGDPYCAENRHCSAGEQPCAAAYQPNVGIVTPPDRPYGTLTNICPDWVQVSYQLCSDVGV